MCTLIVKQPFYACNVLKMYRISIWHYLRNSWQPQQRYIPVGTWRNNNGIITSKRDVVLTL